MVYKLTLEEQTASTPPIIYLAQARELCRTVAAKVKAFNDSSGTAVRLRAESPPVHRHLLSPLLLVNREIYNEVKHLVPLYHTLSIRIGTSFTDKAFDPQTQRILTADGLQPDRTETVASLSAFRDLQVVVHAVELKGSQRHFQLSALLDCIGGRKAIPVVSYQVYYSCTTELNFVTPFTRMLHNAKAQGLIRAPSRRESSHDLEISSQRHAATYECRLCGLPPHLQCCRRCGILVCQRCRRLLNRFYFNLCGETFLKSFTGFSSDMESETLHLYISGGER